MPRQFWHNRPGQDGRTGNRHQLRRRTLPRLPEDEQQRDDRHQRNRRPCPKGAGAPGAPCRPEAANDADDRQCNDRQRERPRLGVERFGFVHIAEPGADEFVADLFGPAEALWPGIDKTGDQRRAAKPCCGQPDQGFVGRQERQRHCQRPGNDHRRQPDRRQDIAARNRIVIRREHQIAERAAQPECRAIAAHPPGFLALPHPV